MTKGKIGVQMMMLKDKVEELEAVSFLINVMLPPSDIAPASNTVVPFEINPIILSHTF